MQPANKVQPKDETLPDYDRPGLETVIAVIRRVMRLLGYPLDPPGSESRVRKKKFAVTVKDPIAAGALKAGDVLVFSDADFPAKAVVLSDGSLELNGIIHDSPSAAAATVRGRPTNGWADWALAREDSTITLMKLREQLTELAPTPEDQPGKA